MKTLTKAEEQVMRVIWNLGHGLQMDGVKGMPELQPHKNMVGTILKILGERACPDRAGRQDTPVSSVGVQEGIFERYPHKHGDSFLMALTAASFLSWWTSGQSP